MTPEALVVLVPSDGVIRCPKAWAGKRVTVKLGRDSRSNQQLRWIKGVALPILAEHLGYDLHTREDLHDEMLIAAFGERVTRDGRRVPAKRTGDLNTKDCAEYQGWLIRWAAQEFGCIIPEPNESPEVD